MADNIFTRANTALADWFGKPTVAKGAPGYIVAGADFSGWTVSELAQLATFIYMALMCVGLIPKVCQSLDFIKKHIKRGKE